MASVNKMATTLKKIKKQMDILETHYTIQKINSCGSCKNIRPYNNTCIKNSIRVNKTFGICDYFETEEK